MGRETFNILRQLSCFDISMERAAELRETLDEFQNWAKLQRDTETHALGPLFYRHFRQHDLPCPDSFAMSLKGLVLRHRTATRIRYQVLSELLQELTAREIQIIGIKGMALAPMLYPEPYLRPMRDMDFLAPLPRVEEVATLMRTQGFDLPEKQTSRYEVLNHHLPNATRKVDGMTISIEVHKDAVNNDSFTRIDWEKGIGSSQQVQWRDTQFATLGHELMLLQLCRHLAGTQSTLKLINVLDVVAYADKYFEDIDWEKLKRRYPFIINTLKCLHLVCPLSQRVQGMVGTESHRELEGVGENMEPVSLLFKKRIGKLDKLVKILNPSEWWLHLHYGVPPGRSLWFTRLVTHPFYLGFWLIKRMASRLLWR
jgi:hypothetical protein